MEPYTVNVIIPMEIWAEIETIRQIEWTFFARLQKQIASLKFRQYQEIQILHLERPILKNTKWDKQLPTLVATITILLS